MVPFEFLINAAERLTQRAHNAPSPVPPAIDFDRASALLQSMLSELGLVPALSDSEAKEAFHGFLAGDQSPFQRIAALHTAKTDGQLEQLTPDDLEETILFCVLLAARAQWARVKPAAESSPAGRANICPVCGGIGRLEVIAGEDGQRSLICPACDARWRISRVGCPHCGEQDGSRMEILSVAEEPGRAMAHCLSCGRAWRRRDTGRQPYPEGASLADAFLPWKVEASVCFSTNILPVPLRATPGADFQSVYNVAVDSASRLAETAKKG